MKLLKSNKALSKVTILITAVALAVMVSIGLAVVISQFTKNPLLGKPETYTFSGTVTDIQKRTEEYRFILVNGTEEKVFEAEVGQIEKQVFGKFEKQPVIAIGDNVTVTYTILTVLRNINNVKSITKAEATK